MKYLIKSIGKGVILISLLTFLVLVVLYLLSTTKITVISYNGHDMIEYQRGLFIVSIIHSPECKKCLQVFD